ncbi:hypothetical protein SELMODRAFT_432359 [Selaginella moellendorffii]|uniref:Uncharacterized protein n=1 Tax=Selaginella moellendorffii TaxID=88036 RepID=D8TFS0_SELML|nr:hypothetical protein SELMODRAFT_432359 [Selaginella moellendorffii]
MEQWHRALRCDRLQSSYSKIPYALLLQAPVKLINRKQWHRDRRYISCYYKIQYASLPVYCESHTPHRSTVIKNPIQAVRSSSKWSWEHHSLNKPRLRSPSSLVLKPCQLAAPTTP